MAIYVWKWSTKPPMVSNNCLGLHETLMDRDLKIAVEYLDQLFNIECNISISEVHQHSMPPLSITALSC